MRLASATFRVLDLIAMACRRDPLLPVERIDLNLCCNRPLQGRTAHARRFVV